MCLREPPWSIGDLLDIQQVVVILAALGVHQDTIDVASVKLAGVMVVVATVVPVTMVIHVGMQERIASVPCLGRLVDGICDEAQARRAHQDDLKDPVADVRDRERLVIASLVAAGLHGVTDEHDLFVFVHLLPYYPNY